MHPVSRIYASTTIVVTKPVKVTNFPEGDFSPGTPLPPQVLQLLIPLTVNNFNPVDRDVVIENHPIPVQTLSLQPRKDSPHVPALAREAIQENQLHRIYPDTRPTDLVIPASPDLLINRKD